MIQDLFSNTLVDDKLKYLKSKKDISWMENKDLRLINDEGELRNAVKQILEDTSDNSPVAVDTETEGLIFGSKLVGISIAWRKKADNQICSFYVPLFSDVDKVNVPSYRSLAILKPVLEKPCVYWHYQFDFKGLKLNGITPKLLADVQVMEILKKEGISYEELEIIKKRSLKEKFQEVFGLQMLEIEDVLGKGNFNFALAPLSLGSRFYASVDSYATLMLYEHFSGEVNKESLAYQIEMMLIECVAMMEYRGIRLDSEALLAAKIEIENEAKEQLNKIYELCGEKFNVDSPIQLGKILFGKMGLKSTEKTEKGQAKTDSKTLDKMKDDHPIIDLLLKYKENSKLLNTFLDKLGSEVSPVSEHIHTSYRTYGAISSRFSSNSPNLQQLPKAKSKDSNKGVVRKAFISDPGFYLLDMDFANIEYRIFASLCKDKGLMDAFFKDVDFHSHTATVMFGIKPDEVTEELRAKAKTINFSLLFGAGVKNLAKQLKVSRPEAQSLFNKYFESMPEVQPWIDRMKKETLETGTAVSYYGYIRRFLNLSSLDEYKLGEALRSAVNHRVQATASGILRIAMLRADKALKDRDDIQMLLQVHDELLFQVKETTPIEEAVAIIKKEAEIKIPDFVPVRSDFAVGYSWGNLIDYEPGVKLEDVPFKDKIIISLTENDLNSKGEIIKKLFEQHKGKHPSFFKIKDYLVETEFKINPTKKLFSEIKNLKLEAA